MVLWADVTLHISVQRCPADPHTILLFPPAVICLAQASPRWHKASFIQHQIRAGPVLEARKSDLSWAQFLPSTSLQSSGGNGPVTERYHSVM